MTLQTNDTSALNSNNWKLGNPSQQRNLVAAFAYHEEARNALSLLNEAGFSEGEAWLVENSSTADKAAPPAAGVAQGGEKHGFIAFIERIFGAGENDIMRNSRLQDHKFSPESERYISTAYEKNHHLLVVQTAAAKLPQAKIILTEAGGVIDDQANQHLARDFEGTATMRLSEEELTARTDQVESGEVILHKEVVTEMQTIEVPVSHEEVVIERKVLNRGDQAALAGEEISNDPKNEAVHVRLMEEQVTIGKKVVPREEITLAKRKIVENKIISEEVRHEEAKVERVANPAAKAPQPKTVNDIHPTI